MGKEKVKEYWKKKKELESRLPKVKDRPQDLYLGFMLWRRQLNNVKFGGKVNPYREEILRWRPPAEVWEPQSITQSKEPIIITTDRQFKSMITELETVSEFAFDMEGHQEYSFLGMTMLVQISTAQSDYIIYVPACDHYIREYLNPIMEDEKIIKVLHGGANDIRHYQRDFRAFPKAVVDTQYIFHYTHRYYADYVAFLAPNRGNRIGFKNIAKILLGDKFPSDYPTDLTLCDWRIFPLTSEMIKYAKYDTSLLLECWQILKQEMSDLHWIDHPRDPIKASNQLTAVMYEFPKPANCEDEIVKQGVSAALQPKFEAFWKWRLERARYVDELPQRVISVSSMLKVLRDNPQTVEELRTVFLLKPLPKWIENVENDVLNLLKQQPVVQEVIREITPEKDMPMECESTVDWDMQDKSNSVNDNNYESLIELHAPQSPIDPEVAPEVAESSVPLPQKSPTYRDDPAALAELPFRLRKWKGIPPKRPPSPKPNSSREGRARVRPKRPPGVPRRRKKLSPTSKAYQTRRRNFNQRQRRKLKKKKAAQDKPEVKVPPPTTTFGGRMCSVSRSSRHLSSSQQPSHHHPHLLPPRSDSANSRASHPSSSLSSENPPRPRPHRQHHHHLSVTPNTAARRNQKED